MKRTRLKTVEKLVESMGTKIVLVEGKHDVRALKAIGAEASFVMAVGKAESVAERLEKAFGNNGKGVKRVFLLLDFDAEGLRKQKFFKVFLEEHGFATDSVFARKLRSLLGFTLVEEIESKYFMLKEKGELHGKNVR
ncbi:MAG: toprim domain-containing protein [Candidatus Micrarchaeota archaeon]